MGVDAQGNYVQEKDYYGAYIRPVEADPRIQQKYVVNGTNRVIVGPSKGFGFCLCWFDSNEKADEFMVKIKQSGINLGKAVDLKVGKAKHANPNGYFRVGTQCGECYISAEKLNEDLQEEVQPVNEATKEIDITPTEDELAGSIGGHNFEKYEDAWFRG